MTLEHFPNLTLATTVHNNAAMSADMLRSFEEHVGTAAEVVVVDDGSTPPIVPPTLRSSVRLVRHDKPKGFCGASDRALREVKTDFALLVDADVLFSPGDFKGGFAEFCKDPKLAWCGFLQRTFAGAPQGSFEVELVPPWVFGLGNQAKGFWEKFSRQKPQSSSRIAPVAVAHSSCALVNMAAYRAVGGFDLWYWQCESDIALSLRFLQHGYKVGVDQGYTLRHEGAGGKTGGLKRTLDLYRARLHLYEEFYPGSRRYLRTLLWARHLGEYVLFKARARQGRCSAEQLELRRLLLKGARHGYPPIEAAASRR